MKGLALHIIEETMKVEDEMLQEIFDNMDASDFDPAEDERLFEDC